MTSSSRRAPRRSHAIGDPMMPVTLFFIPCITWPCWNRRSGLDQAAPLQGWSLPRVHDAAPIAGNPAEKNRCAAGKREYVQVLASLAQTFPSAMSMVPCAMPCVSARSAMTRSSIWRCAGSRGGRRGLIGLLSTSGADRRGDDIGVQLHEPVIGNPGMTAASEP